ncbi:MAG: hypothetical protein ACOX6X_08135 [Dethiobacteria bacterium]|jgi:hypothetical protein
MNEVNEESIKCLKLRSFAIAQDDNVITQDDNVIDDQCYYPQDDNAIAQNDNVRSK